MKAAYRFPVVAWATLLPTCITAALIPVAVAAQLSTSPGYTTFDQQQQAKLRAWVGTWKCVGDDPLNKSRIYKSDGPEYSAHPLLRSKTHEPC